MHFLGIAGMPRRIPDYPDQFLGWNWISSYGSMVSLVSSAIFIYVVFDLLAGKYRQRVPSFYIRLPIILPIGYTKNN